MSTQVRNGVVLVALLVLSVLASLYVTTLWTVRFVVDRSFVSSYSWWSPAELMDATDEFLLLLVVGAALPVVLNVQRPIVWAFVFGLAFGFARWSVGWHWINPDLGVIEYLWAYSSSFTPVIGGVVGACLTVIGQKVLSRNVA